ncbi:hypothetical protein F4703DRAFT_1735382 [Phycomyces blakesleeanus]
MTFDQLTTVRHDKIVNEEIVFRALWQREALERIIFPFHFQSSQPIPSEEDYNGKDPTQDRSEALNEYFDVDDTVDQERRRRILLGTPKFRFRKSIHLTPATVANGWKLIEKSNANSTNDKAPTETTYNDANESEDELENLLNSLEDEEDSFYESDQIVRSNQYLPASYSKTFYSRPEKILGSSYSVAVEAQVMPRHLLYMNNTNNKKEGSNDEENPSDKNVLVCRFELSQRANIRYSIYCLNTHENLTENQRVDQEDRVLVPVTESAELLQHNDSESGYVGQTIIHADMSEGVTIDLTVALEVFGFENV